MEAANPVVPIQHDADQLAAAKHKMPALVAMLRHDLRISEADVYMHNNQRWVRATALYEGHRRFHCAFPFAAMIEAVRGHKDRTGNLYVLTHVDRNGEYWFHAPRH